MDSAFGDSVTSSFLTSDGFDSSTAMSPVSTLITTSPTLALLPAFTKTSTTLPAIVAGTSIVALSVSISRIIDGADAIRFLRFVVESLENPIKLLL